MKRYRWHADGMWCLEDDEPGTFLFVYLHDATAEKLRAVRAANDEAAARIAAKDREVEAARIDFARVEAALTAARTELAQLREGIALRAKGQVGPDALVKDLRTELAAARVNEARVAVQVLKVRDRMIEQNYSEAWHQLYQIASPDFTSHTPWRELERLANYSGAYSMDSQLAAEKGAQR